MKHKALVIFAILIVKFYKYTLSPILPHSCRFYPSCSDYCMLVLRKYGFFKGSWLALRRIVRCHPLNAGGYDPV